jgi:tRNA G18 (ribose-2'-O)-methylase SpoU
MNDTRNIHDFLKSLSTDDVADYCQSNSISAAVAMVHISGDFNFSTVVRNANFFGFREVFYIGGAKKWDQRGSVGAHHYTPMTHFKTYDEFFSVVNGRYTTIALENQKGTKTTNLFDFKWPSSPVIIIGEERLGLSDEFLNNCDHIVEIPTFGCIRSLNAGTASGIAMSHYRSQMYEHTT